LRKNQPVTSSRCHRSGMLGAWLLRPDWIDCEPAPMNYPSTLRPERGGQATEFYFLCYPASSMSFPNHSSSVGEAVFAVPPFGRSLHPEYHKWSMSKYFRKLWETGSLNSGGRKVSARAQAGRVRRIERLSMR
jgi:hypothetical protein